MDLDMPPKDEPNVTLTIRLIMQGKEVGSIIGKKGEIVNSFRAESGAKINISDGSCPERIVTVTGSTGAIFKAFTLICKKFEEWCSQFQEVNSSGSGVPRPPITLRLIVPASQCGSLIGKGGSKIKQIREVTGASIQVASEMLPNSTERAVTISGTGEAITQCIYHICTVMLESPPKGATIPYRPKPQVGGPVILAGGQAYTIQGNYAVPAHTDVSNSVMTPLLTPHLSLGHPLTGAVAPVTAPLVPLEPLKNVHLQAALPPGHLLPDIAALGKSPLAGLAALGLGGLAPANTGGLNPAALAALAGSQLRTASSRNQQNANQQTHEMTVPNELIGCIIGKGGTKIAEIRQISGAMIRISNCDDRESGVTDRTITISGNPDAVALAQYLINMSVELQKANLEAQNSPSTGGTSQSSTTAASPLASAIPLAQLLTKPGALNALTSLSALGGLTELLGGQTGAPPVQTTGVHRSHKNYTPRLRSPGGSGQSEGSKVKNDRKFNPY
ncbi:poly(rC)-binding protein 3 isoform X1 [Coccinella septempunctata]|uniref:poly(rC)-binding protein 3 isoform X1 n=1 Tax=Coccinella septempunctata TaxID=41139 RepID=UPI001D0763B2|nr:poly(rC)-binding protein 3 isoform X1 [Coccinella septempunctata]XP_044761255.1 poly(rC)-binding protein 3 isoform X1 [Coccinella septempunctata]XP_044761256.1 poly(rC)-binding protein 3 isoform X1 [Coccinella septempunctata]XP_044761257.1 poly(rC)-binding protein 3 isoform X1 [Coccinella septempunctata]